MPPPPYKTGKRRPYRSAFFFGVRGQTVRIFRQYRAYAHDSLGKLNDHLVERRSALFGKRALFPVGTTCAYVKAFRF